MKKRKWKLSLNKKTISKLQNSQMDGVRGVGEPNTKYPISAISGCWGAQTCFEGDPTFPYTRN